ncbi:MAG: hypothetical protein IJO57_02445 [Bacilli bacterium]|nr:hypothetical protein [Bacilli bacterium]
MARYYVKMDALKEEGILIKDYAVNTVGAKFNELIEISKNLSWSGPSSVEFKKMFEEKIKKLNDISSMIEMFGKFMITASDGFVDVNKKVENNLNGISNDKNLAN